MPATLRSALFMLLLACAPGTARQSVEWPVYGGDNSNCKYSPLAQIDASNVKRLHIVWRWTSPDGPIAKAQKLTTWLNEGTPIMVDGVLYVSTGLSQVAAIDAATGRTKWVFDPHSYKAGQPTNMGFTHRGVAYWTDGSIRRIFIGTGNSYLIALDARTGAVVSSFGQSGKIDLTRGLGREVPRKVEGLPLAVYGVTSPPLVCRDTVIVGSSILDYPILSAMPPGDVRGFDVRTGKLRWTFHVIPRAGELGTETWQADSWKTAGAGNVWTIMSADDALGYVYLPCSTPSNDYYGGNRPGDGLFGETLVCLDAHTGKRIWHYQIVHHGLWDYDLPAAPILADITCNGRRIKAVAQLTKHGFCFVFDRVTGKPVWPIEERPVPQSQVPGEQTSPTQPVPTKPPPFDRQGVTDADLIDFTPDLHRRAQAFVDKYVHGPLFTPPSERGTINLPGWGGGANWAGGAFDPDTGVLYVPSVTSAIVASVIKAPAFASDARYVGSARPLMTMPNGLSPFKPPYGRITAIDLKTGNLRWTIPMGEGPRRNPLLAGLKLPPLGWDRRGWVLATRTLLFVGQEPGLIKRATEATRGHHLNVDMDVADDAPALRVLDKRTGRQLWRVSLPDNETGAQMTYELHGRQYIVVPTGGLGQPARLVALAVQ